MHRRLGRALGGGRLTKEQRGNGEPRWVLDYKDGNGIRRRQALSVDRRVAERMKIEIISKRDLQMAGLASVEGQSRPLSEVQTIYLADLKARVSTSHYKCVEARVARVLNGIRIRRVRDLLPHHLIEWRTKRIATTGHRTVNHEIKNVKAMLNWAVQAGLIHQNPVASLTSLPVSKQHIKRRRRALTEDETRRFLTAAAEDDREQADHVAAVRCIEAGVGNEEWRAKKRATRIPQLPLWRGFIETGARYGELSRVAWGDFDRERRTITLRDIYTKNGKARVIPLSDEFAAVLIGLHALQAKALDRAVGKGDRVFLSPEGCDLGRISKNSLKIFWRILARAGIPRANEQGDRMDIHGLRHTFASRLARAGVSLQHAQRLMGHSNPALTAMIYTHVDAEDLRVAIDRVPPVTGMPTLVRSSGPGVRTG